MITAAEIVERRKRVVRRLKELHSDDELVSLVRDNCIFVAWKKKSS